MISTLILSCNGPKSGPLVKESFEKDQPKNMAAAQAHQSQAVVAKADIKLEPCADCITIGRLMADKKSFAGKSIKVKGVVTKVNEGIMDKNWIHLQDGTESEGVYDLTVTTSQKASVGETITIEGKIVLDKDFGYGYFYNVLMEEGNIIR